MKYLVLNKKLLVQTIAANSLHSEHSATAIINTVLAQQGRVHGETCKNNPYAKDVCEGMYADKEDERLELVAALRAIYAIAGEDPQIAHIIEKALEDE